MIVLVHENPDKSPNVTPFQHFRSGFDHKNHASSFHNSKILPKIDSVLRIFSNMST